MELDPKLAQKVLDADGFHALRWTWNERGQLEAQERFVGPEQLAPDGWARQVHRYDRFGRLATIAYQDGLGQAKGVWNGVGLVRLMYGRNARLAKMSWHRADGQALNAAVCFPSAYCGRQKVHEARYVYGDAEQPTRMTLHDTRGKLRVSLTCDAGECF